MPDMYFDVDVALTEVPVNIMPLIDDTDFKTIEGAVAFNAAGMALRWHFITSAGAYTVTSVTPTSGGDYDWTDQGDSGIYTIEIPASGGASINNDTEGYGWFTGVATGVLPWRGPIIGFRAAGLNDLLCDSAFSVTRGLTGTALPAAAADAAGGLPISDAGGLDLDAKIGALTFTVANKVDANATHISGDSVAADNAEAFFDGTGYAGTNNVIPTVTTLTNLPAITANWLTAAGTAADFSTELRTAINGGDYALSTDANGRIRIVDGTGTGEINTNAGAIALVDTVTTLTNLPAITANWLTAAGTAADFGAEIADAVWDEANGTHVASGTTGRRLYDASISLTMQSDGAVNDAAATTTSFKTTLTDPSNFWNDMLLMFTSGALTGQARPIASYSQTDGLVTFDEALTSAPANGVTFLIKIDHIHPISQIADGILDRSAATHTTNSTLGAIINDWEDAGRLDTILDSRASQASITALNNIAAADVWAVATRTLTALGFDLAAGDFAAGAIDANALATDAVNELRNAITGGAYALDTDANGRVRIVDGTGTGEIDTTSGAVAVTAASVRSAVGLASANLDTQLDTLPTAAENAAALLDLTDGVETGVTPRQALRGLCAAVFGTIADAGTGTETFKSAGGSTTRLVYTVDSSGNRTLVVLSL